jgi:BON domain
MARKYERDEQEGPWRNQRQNREHEDDYGWNGPGQDNRNWRGDPSERSDWNRNMGGGWSQGRRWNMPEQGQHAGRGPRSFKRQDSRIEEDVNEQLTRHPMVDATDVEVQVQNGEVTLRGYVDSREAKRMSEDVAESVFGVKDVHNQLKVKQRAEDRKAS